MRRLMLFGMVTFMMMAISGCTHIKPEFNQTYLPNAVPGSPKKRIDLPKLVTQKTVAKRGGFFSKSRYFPTSLYWVEEDNLLFNVMSEGKQSVLYSFLIIPSTGEIKLLEGAEKHVLLGELDKRTSLVSAETAGSQFLKGAASALIITLQIAAAAATGGGNLGTDFADDYTGRIENNGKVLDFDISIKRSGKVTYTTKNNRTENTLKGEVLLESTGNIDSVDYNARKWLNSWRISPDGRYYIISSSAMIADSKEEYAAFEELIDSYDQVYAGFDINPSWDKIALLNSKEDERTKQVTYWIEFYPFDYRANEKRQQEAMTEKEQRANVGCCCCLWPFRRGD
jgi:hypothetical protein